MQKQIQEKDTKMYYIDESVNKGEIKAFLEKYGFDTLRFPEVPALKRESATCFIHAIRGGDNQGIYALIYGVNYERNMDFDVLMPSNVGFDFYSVVSKRYFVNYYRMNHEPNRLTWRLNGIIQQNPSSEEVAFPPDRIEKLMQML